VKTITLNNRAVDGSFLQAVFLPERGLNLVSYTKGKLEAIDPNTRSAFEATFSGLGPLIGPHFYRQKKEWIARNFDESFFPHIVEMRKKGSEDPFPHGIARYVPWKCQVTQSQILAKLSSHDTYKGEKLSTFEGVDFEMDFRAELLPEGLEIEMSVQSPRVCLAGIHYYYALQNRHGKIRAVVQDVYNDMGIFKPMPKEWCKADLQHLEFDLSHFADYGFLPLKNHQGEIHFETEGQGLNITYQGDNEQISWQLYSPKDATFVCIEPMSARNPRGLEVTHSHFIARIEIV